MKRILTIIVMAVGLMSSWASENCAGQLFTTSKSFDLIASLQYFDNIKDEPRFSHLAVDSTFMEKLKYINDNVKASKLCNFYATFGGNRDDADSCVMFFTLLPENSKVISSEADWIRNIANMSSDLSLCLSAINNAGFPEYWDTVIRPYLDRYINSYPVSKETLDAIHEALTEFSGPESLSETHSNIFVLNIDNAFNLSDESFCCAPLLLDKEMEKRFRLDFLKVYTHENLHRLKISDALINKLEELKADDFYRENEKVASGHGEGLNEAFVVAAEVYISHKIGRRDARSVYDEFREYVDGSLVLAPIIYVHLDEKRSDESLNDFVLRLLDSGIISAGTVQAEYDKAMTRLKSQI